MSRITRSSAHDGVEVAWIERANASYHIGSVGYQVPTGAIMVVPSGVEHVTRLAAGLTAGSVLLEVSLLDEVHDAIRRGSRAPRNEARILKGSPKALTLTRLLDAEAFGDQEPGFEIVVDTLMEALAVELLRAGATEDGGGQRLPRDPRIRRAVQCIEERYAERLTIDELARVARLSRFHFSRLFASDVGISPYRYLTLTRVRSAARQLTSGKASVTEAAFAVGFGNLGRFSRSFRAEVGVSPAEFLRVARATTARCGVRSARSG